MEMEANLRRAVDEGELFVEYQPQVDLTTNKASGVEALVRWNHPKFGVVGPDSFIALAEESNLILAIGEWVMRSVFNQCVLWKKEGRLPPRVGINVSGRQFAQSDFVATVIRLLRETGADPNCLEFEITENILVEDTETAIKTLERLRALGIRLAIDDFGTGYSSLSCLKKLPVNRLKIDKSFIHDLHTNANDRAIVTATIEMARGLGLEIIAEGVETQEQCRFMQESNCDEIQGFYFSKPLSVDAVQDKWLRQKDEAGEED